MVNTQWALEECLFNLCSLTDLLVSPSKSMLRASSSFEQIFELEKYFLYEAFDDYLSPFVLLDGQVLLVVLSLIGVQEIIK